MFRHPVDERAKFFDLEKDVLAGFEKDNQLPLETA